MSNTLVPEPADIQSNSVGWRHLTRLEPYFHGSHKKSVVGSDKLGAPKNPAILDEFSATAYEYMVDLFASTTAIGISSPAVQILLWNQDSAIHSLQLFAKSKSIEELSSLDREP